jgi:molecular chaperone DnaK
VERVSAGIDLGTTNSCLAVLEGERPVVVPNDLGAPVTPSVVAVLPEGIVVGKAARSRLLTHPANTFASIKRRMGERYTRTVLGKEYTPESVSALILSHLKTYGERHLGRPIEDAVITVPANFNSLQRQASKDAGEIAGFNVLRVLNEPTAAALAYGHQHQLSAVLVVFDLGGGTFDISVVEAGDGLYEVIYSAGDNHLGGDDFNLRIVQWIAQEFEKKTGLDFRRDIPALSLAHEWAVAAKHRLTDVPEVRVKIDNLYRGQPFDAVLTRAAFEELCKDLFNRLNSIAWSVSEELRRPKYAEAYPGVFDRQLEGCDILLVGGETRVPTVRRLVQTIFRGRVHTDVNPDEVVAMGAALQAGIVHQKGGVKDIILVDTTALSLGIAVQGTLFDRVIDANTRIPCSRTKNYYPVSDYQPSGVVSIYQGESELCANNIKLGEFEFLLQPPRPRDQAAVVITFQLDANDILHVSAVDKLTGAQQSVTIKDSQSLDRATVERLRQEAKQARADDQAQAKRLRLRQRLELWLAEVWRQLQPWLVADPGNEYFQRAADFAEQLERALGAGDDDLIDRAARDLEVAWQKLITLHPELGPEPEVPETATTPPSSAPAPAGAETVRCANCNAQLPPGFAFCGKCGTPLKKDRCRTCGAALAEGFQFCGRCGAKLE